MNGHPSPALIVSTIFGEAPPMNQEIRSTVTEADLTQGRHNRSLTVAARDGCSATGRRQAESQTPLYKTSNRAQNRAGAFLRVGGERDR
jgi:hypothetical protein